jgi:hypothetical protein
VSPGLYWPFAVRGQPTVEPKPNITFTGIIMKMAAVIMANLRSMVKRDE